MFSRNRRDVFLDGGETLPLSKIPMIWTLAARLHCVCWTRPRVHPVRYAKGYGEAIVDEVIERLIRVQLIDDGAYAESAVRYCAGRMMGRRGTVMELARKGVDRKLAEQVCDEAEQNGIFEDAAWELGRQIARKTHGLDRQVRQRRFWSAGGRKGHSPETLRRVAAELLV